MRLLAGEQAHLVQRGAHAAPGLVRRRARDAQRQRDVLAGAAVEEQLVVLEDEADVTAQDGEGRLAERGEVLPVDDHAAARGALDAGRELEQRGLAPAPERPVTTTSSPAATSKDTSRRASWPVG